VSLLLMYFEVNRTRVEVVVVCLKVKFLLGLKRKSRFNSRQTCCHLVKNLFISHQEMELWLFNNTPSNSQTKKTWENYTGKFVL
jgi:hypothetical protein